MRNIFRKKIVPFVISAICCLPSAIVAMEIRINALGYEGKNARLIAFGDFITYLEVTLDEQEVDNNGKVTLNTNIPAVSLFLIRIDDVNAALHIEPDKHYEISFPSYDKVDGKILSKQKFVIPEIISEPPSQINSELRKFNAMYDNFIVNNYTLFARGDAKSAIDEFKIETATIFDMNNDYLGNYINFGIANLELSGNYSKRLAFETYFKDKKVAYNVQTYFEVFSNFYLNYLSRFQFSATEIKLDAAIKKQNNFDSLLSVLKNDLYIQSDEIASLVALQELYKAKTNQSFEEQLIINLITQASQNACCTEIKTIANNMLHVFGKLKEGTNATDFQLINQKGENIDLSSFKGKYVYLDFWATWCTPCIKEFPLMDSIYQKHSDILEIVSISIDKSKSRYERFLRNNNYPWTFAHFNNDQKLMEAYNIKVIPTYFLIDPEGKLIHSPAKSPSQGFESFLLKLKTTDEKQSKQPKIWDWNQKIKR